MYNAVQWSLGSIGTVVFGCYWYSGVWVELVQWSLGDNGTEQSLVGISNVLDGIGTVEFGWYWYSGVWVILVQQWSLGHNGTEEWPCGVFQVDVCDKCYVCPHHS